MMVYLADGSSELIIKPDDIIKIIGEKLGLDVQTTLEEYIDRKLCSQRDISYDEGLKDLEEAQAELRLIMGEIEDKANRVEALFMSKNFSLVDVKNEFMALKDLLLELAEYVKI